MKKVEFSKDSYMNSFEDMFFQGKYYIMVAKETNEPIFVKFFDNSIKLDSKEMANKINKEFNAIAKSYAEEAMENGNMVVNIYTNKIYTASEYDYLDLRHISNTKIRFIAISDIAETLIILKVILANLNYLSLIVLKRLKSFTMSS